MFTNKYSRRAAEAEQPSEAKQTAGKGFMAELDQWLDEMVFEPIERAISDEDSKELHIAFAESKQHIKRKVLASYHNGLKAKSAAIINQNNHEQYKKNYRRN